jgi:uncharacterized protein YeeX (DUF496 family)
MKYSLLIDLLAYSVPAIVVFFTAFYLIKTMLKAQLQAQELKIKANAKSISIPIRLQAYERLTLLMERIDLFSLVQKFRTPNMTVSELQLLMTNQIRQEFEHNLSQQVYVSHDLWVQIRGTKEQMIMTVNRIGASMPPNISAKEFTRALMEYLNEMDGTLPTHNTLEKIKSEAALLF